MFGGLYLAGTRGNWHRDDAIRGRHHLTGEHHSLPGLGFAQGVLEVLLTQIVFPLLAAAFAGAADPVRAVHRQVDLVAIGGIEDLLAVIAFDEASGPVFEIQCYAISHISLR